MTEIIDCLKLIVCNDACRSVCVALCLQVDTGVRVGSGDVGVANVVGILFLTAISYYTVSGMDD